MEDGTASLFEAQSPFKTLQDYYELIPKMVEKVKFLSKPFKGLRIVHVNATALGGGVAEMLSSQVPLERDTGFDSRWLVIPPNEAFFEVTKSIHNYLQGKEGSLTNRQKQIYLNHNRLIAKLLDEINSDILIIHDPQPAAVLHFMKKRPKVALWRCHIDTTSPNEEVFNFLFPYLEEFNSYIFTMREFASKKFPKEKLHFMTPVIDPFSLKNRVMDIKEAKDTLQKLGVDMGRPLVTQVSRLDPWKDPIGVIDSFTVAQKEIPDLQLAFVAQMASDDPEGVKIYKEVRRYAKGKKGIYFFINLGDNDRVVNAFQTASDVILQKSVREGFALTVTEAMWKYATVVGGNVGGIRLQIKNGINGFLVNSSKEAADKIIFILKNPEKIEKLKTLAHRGVKSHFLMPHLLSKEIKLFRKLLL